MIDQILRGVKKLPAFPETVRKVTALLRNDDYSVAEVVDIVKYDQAIAANIMKMSNSAYFGVRQRIRTIRDAVVYLGQKHLIRIIQTASISKFFMQNRVGYGSTSKDLWEHSVAVALMSQILSRQLRDGEDSVLYTAALLHDIGKLVMGEYVTESYGKIHRLVSEQGMSFLDAEEEVIGINHAELGGRIAEQWNFPPELRDAIAHHHRPDLLNHQGDTVPCLVYLADQFCLMMGVDGGMDGLAYEGFSEVMKKFSLREIDLERDMVMLLDELEEAGDVLNVVG